MRRALTLSVALLLLTGCHTSAPSQPDLSHLTDEALVHLNQKDGAGLGLKIDGRTFHRNQPIPLHIALEDFSSPTPIGAGLCSGLALGWENLATNDGGFASIHLNPTCFHQPDPDLQPLPQGKLQTFNITQQDQHATLDLPPGAYLLNISWQRYPAGPGNLLTRKPGTLMMSNPINITILP